MRSNASRQLVHVAYVVELHLDGCLQSAAQHVDQCVVAHTVLHYIMARVDVGGQFLFVGHPIETLLVDDETCLTKDGLQLLIIRASGDIEVNVLSLSRLHVG